MLVIKACAGGVNQRVFMTYRCFVVEEEDGNCYLIELELF